jgi:hypothetical protein
MRYHLLPARHLVCVLNISRVELARGVFDYVLSIEEAAGPKQMWHVAADGWVTMVAVDCSSPSGPISGPRTRRMSAKVPVQLDKRRSRSRTISTAPTIRDRALSPPVKQSSPPTLSSVYPICRHRHSLLPGRLHSALAYKNRTTPVSSQKCSGYRFICHPAPS